MLKALHVNAGNLYGGVEVVLRELALYQTHDADIQFDHAVFFDGRSSAELRSLSQTVHVLGDVRLRNPGSIWIARKRLARILKEYKYDVVIPHGAWNHVIAAPVARRCGTRVLFWLHDPPQPRPNWIERWASFIPPAYTICNSRYTQERLDRIFPKSDSRIVYCPVTPVPLNGRESVRNDWRKMNGIGEDETIILQISRLQPHKGFRTHIEALAKLRTGRPWRAIFVAQPQTPEEEEYSSGLKASAEKAGIADRILFLGWQKEIDPLFLSADIYCQPNEGPEPFGITFVQALSAGLAVVSSRTGGPVEILEGGCGSLIEPGDVDALATTLTRLIEHPRDFANMTRQGLAKAESMCSAETTWRELRIAVNRTLEGARRAVA